MEDQIRELAEAIAALQGQLSSSETMRNEMKQKMEAMKLGVD